MQPIEQAALTKCDLYHQDEVFLCVREREREKGKEKAITQHRTHWAVHTHKQANKRTNPCVTITIGPKQGHQEACSLLTELSEVQNKTLPSSSSTAV